MTAKRFFAAAFLASFAVLFFCGCAPEADVALRLAPSEVSAYKCGDVYRKDYLFEQPSSNKRTEKTTETNVEVTYDQLVTGVDAEQNTTAKVTIKALKYLSTSSGEVQIDFDSSRDTDSESAFAKLLGQTYTIEISSSGKVLGVSDVASARDAVKTGPDARFAERLLSDDNIQQRHEILALPDKDKRTLKVGDKWSRIVPSPQGVLIPKTYEEVYTVEKISNTKTGKQVLIEMKATPSSKQVGAKSKQAGLLEMFGNSFDSEDDFTGRLLIDVETGKVYEYSESFKSQYTAAEFPKGQEKSGQPDVLKLGFTEVHSVKLID
jgi:hypothetical protein